MVQVKVYVADESHLGLEVKFPHAADAERLLVGHSLGQDILESATLTFRDGSDLLLDSLEEERGEFIRALLLTAAAARLQSVAP